MKKNNFILIYTLCSAYFFCSNLIASQERQRLISSEKKRIPLVITWRPLDDFQAEKFYQHSFKSCVPVPKKNTRCQSLAPVAPNVSCNQAGGTLLHGAVRANNEEAVKKLLNSGLSPNKKDLMGNTPLYIACEKGLTKIVKLLLSRRTTNPNIRNSELNAPIHIACKNNFPEIVQLLCNNHRTNLNQEDEGKSTSLHIVCRNNNLFLLNTLRAGKKFSNNNLKINHCNIVGFTPLTLACIYNSYESAEQLLKLNDTDPNVKSFDGSTPLHNAIEFGNTDIVTLLLAHEDINPTARDKNTIYVPHSKNITYESNNSPLHLACLKKNAVAVQLLLAYKPKYRKAVDPNMENADFLTPLHIAVSNEDIESTALLLHDKRTNPNGGSRTPILPLHVACNKRNVALVKLLLEHDDILPSVTLPDLLSPLHIAVANEDIEIVRLFLNHKKRNINLCDCDEEKNTPLDLAYKTGNNAIIELLRQHGANTSAGLKCYK